MVPSARDRAGSAHPAFAMAVEIRARPAAGRPHGALQRAALLPSLRQHDRALARPDAAGAAPLRRLRRLPRGEALLERSELLAYRIAREHLRVGGWIALGPLPVAYRFFRRLERIDKRKGVPQSLVVEFLAEPGVVAVVVAAERGVKRVGGGDDEGVVVLERLDEPPGETGRDHDHFPLDAAVGKHTREGARRELRELKGREIQHKPVVAATVG